MTGAQLEALLEFIEEQAAYSSSEEDCRSKVALRAAIVRVYAAFGITPPPIMGLSATRAETP